MQAVSYNPYPFRRSRQACVASGQCKVVHTSVERFRNATLSCEAGSPKQTICRHAAFRAHTPRQHESSLRVHKPGKLELLCMISHDHMILLIPYFLFCLQNYHHSKYKYYNMIQLLIQQQYSSVQNALTANETDVILVYI